ncbi:MAG: ATP-binding cassette domain-containing protein [Bdellovibrionales bacterium]|nr:ATP-binding cassette domain-containing protein [Bdellovibrionales bacterium]
MLEIAVDINNVYKSFDGGQEFVLKGMNLKIPKGQLTVIIGFSGTGKSVLLKHILGLHTPTSGTVSVFGQDLNTMTMEQKIKFRTNLGVMFQHAALFDDITVLENVCFPLVEHRRDLSADEIIDIARARLKISGLDEKHYHKLPEALSGGMRKRVGLARALALNPDILLYDEPTTGLDPILTEMVDNLILDTHRHQKGTTSVVVSHDLLAAFRIADHVVMLDKGKVLLEGTQEDFFNTDIELVSRFISKGFRKD